MFDEYEEWNLIQGHYTIAVAFIDPVNAASNHSADQSILEASAASALSSETPAAASAVPTTFSFYNLPYFHAFPQRKAAMQQLPNAD